MKFINYALIKFVRNRKLMKFFAKFLSMLVAMRISLIRRQYNINTCQKSRKNLKVTVKKRAS